MSDRNDGPVLIELDETGPSPAEAPPIGDEDRAPTGQAMQTMATLAASRRSRLAIWFWRLLVTVVLFFASVAAWDFVNGLLARNEILGMTALGLLGLFALVCLAILIREWAALARLARIESLHVEADRVIAANDLAGARALTRKLVALYAGREDMRWGRDRLADAESEAFDADTLIRHAEDTLLDPLDARARREVEAAARQVATVTALVPLALADVVTALVATGAVAVGDDLIGSIGGGHLLSRISRRFGEGIVNGALTARVGVAAMEVCRPLPFSDGKRPRVTRLVQRSLTGLFDRAEAPEKGKA